MMAEAAHACGLGTCSKPWHCGQHGLLTSSSCWPWLSSPVSPDYNMPMFTTVLCSLNEATAASVCVGWCWGWVDVCFTWGQGVVCVKNLYPLRKASTEGLRSRLIGRYKTQILPKSHKSLPKRDISHSTWYRGKSSRCQASNPISYVFLRPSPLT